VNPEDVGRILDEIGQRIGPAGEYAWQLTVRQVHIDAWLWMGFGVLILVAAIVCSSLLAYNFVAHKKWADGALASFWLYSVCAWLIGGGIVVANVVRLLNPEYHAMMQLVNQVMPK
jgi:hypothetical protein